MATAALSRVVRGGASAGLAARGLLSAGLSKAPRQSPSLPTTVLSRVFCSNGNEKCFKIADLVEMNNRIDIVENELKYKVQLLEFKLESERAWARGYEEAENAVTDI
uniref:Uncharacterized protein n=1 Tax=Oryza punctata TaxID=4537 RepID=A0A0E0LHA5_ORYPU